MSNNPFNNIEPKFSPARCGICGGVIDGNGDNWNESQGTVLHNVCPFPEEPEYLERYIEE